jgi:hypothetical protein
VVQDPFHSQPSPMDDAPRHINLLELHIWHAQICA